MEAGKMSDKAGLSDTASSYLDITVSVVLVTYNTGPILFRSIESVLSQDALADLIIVNNGNPVEDLERLETIESKDERVKVLSGHGNIGFSAGCNLGAKSARGSCLMLFNPDCIMASETLVKLINIGRKKIRPWMLGCRLVGSDGKEQSGSRRRALTPLTAFITVFSPDWVFRLLPKLNALNFNSNPIAVDTEKVLTISGACMILPTADYWSLNGMDEEFFIHVEDIDFCHRFRRNKGEIFYVPSVRVTHALSTSRASQIFIEWNKARGFMIYFNKNFSSLNSFIVMLIKLGILIRFLLKALKLVFFEYIANIFGRKRTSIWNFPMRK
ncbi:MAG: hypothetical protein CL568_05065 [Alphaproteobacteria bacterium]|jgi:GT2 family glycosyltransferase|nr:hypothetical protein [Alphaproteobacteria bacterium]|tara:strand:+ start:4801 stop:5784 length:984 start_codon:yes stop_codon:yes gene_type:complete